MSVNRTCDVPFWLGLAVGGGSCFSYVVVDTTVRSVTSVWFAVVLSMSSFCSSLLVSDIASCGVKGMMLVLGSGVSLLLVLAVLIASLLADAFILGVMSSARMANSMV